MEAARQGNEHVFNAFLRDVPVSTKYYAKHKSWIFHAYLEHVQ